MTPERHRDGRNIDAFEGEALVVCPTCAHMAWSREVLPHDSNGLAPRRLTCDHCGLVRSRDSGETRRQWRQTPIRDGHFGLPLWLQKPCCGEVLWAYNADHLAFLEAFVGARLRERHSRAAPWRSNSALMSRLPAWLKSRKHRDEVLACIASLQATLA